MTTYSAMLIGLLLVAFFVASFLSPDFYVLSLHRGSFAR
jgi:hypothetical protein